MTTPPAPIKDEQLAQWDKTCEHDLVRAALIAEVRQLRAFRNEYHAAQQRRTALVERCERAEYQLVSMREVLERVKMAATLPDKEDWDNIDSALSASTDYTNKVVVDREKMKQVMAREYHSKCPCCGEEKNLDGWKCGYCINRMVGKYGELLARLDSLRSQGGGE